MTTGLSFDPGKRIRTLVERGLDFADCAMVFEALHFTCADTRAAYGEPRFITIGPLRHRLVVIVWTPRDTTRRIISMRNANAREQARYQAELDRSG